MFLIWFGLLLLGNAPCDGKVHPDVFLTTVEMIQRQGYPVEEHANVQTSDGYLLDLHRMPRGKHNADRTNKPVVFLMHGLLCSSADWVNMGPEKSLAYLLVDLGYDVWMGNARGNKFSRKHITHDPDRDSKFWSFSWHEIGTIDLPTMIDYVLKTTNQDKLYYIGHSQGTTSFFVMGSERPDYNNKIRLMVALAPVAYMSHSENPFFQLLSNFHTALAWVTSFLGINEFLPSTPLMQMIGQAACNDKSLFQGLCANTLFLIAGWNSAQLNQSMIPVITSNAPAGAATKQFLHYGQGIKNGQFLQYDHGLLKNIIKYGSIVPPSYNTGGVTAPVALIYSSNDWLAAEIDVNRLAKELPNLAEAHLVTDPKFNHLDFLYAIDCRKLVYNKILELFNKFS